MRRVHIELDKVNRWETWIGGLRSGYELVTPQMFPDVVRASLDGAFFPYTMDERVTELDEHPLWAVRIKLMPLRRPKKK